MTRGTGRNTDARPIEMLQNILSFNVFERDVRRVWQTFRTFPRAVHTRVRNLFENSVFETIAQLFNALVTVVLLCELARSAECDDVWNSQRSRAASLLLSAADNKRRERNVVSQVERADALRRVQLVAGKREQIDFGCFQVDRNFANCLNAVNMKQCF